MKKVSASFVSGAVALVFVIIGYQAALLVHYASAARIAANHPDTIFVETSPAYANTPSMPRGEPAKEVPDYSSSRNFSPSPGYGKPVKKSSAPKPGTAQTIRKKYPRKVESFRFNPNTASIEDFMRLGFSEKQARSIDSYRAKGGRFRRASDFAKSYVVSDSVFARLEKYIDIPRLDLNAADSAAFDSLPGIGGYFARKMVEYRTRLHGYSYPEQLMEIYHFDQEKFDALSDLVFAGPCPSYDLWTLPADSLSLHPYIGSSARSIVFFRDHNPRSNWTLDALLTAGILTPSSASRLQRCRITSP